MKKVLLAISLFLATSGLALGDAGETFKPGMTISEIEKIHGKPFRVTGVNEAGYSPIAAINSYCLTFKPIKKQVEPDVQYFETVSSNKKLASLALESVEKFDLSGTHCE